MDTGLAGKVVLVTGASGGIGGDIVRAFASEGCRVVAHYGKKKEAAEALATEIGQAVIPLGANLTQEEEVEKLFADAEAKLGRVEILIANAGYWPPEPTPLHKMTLERWNATLGDNLTSLFLTVRQLTRGIVAHAIEAPAAVMIGSTAGLFGEAGHGDYAAAKAAINFGFLRTMKNEMSRIAPRGRINVVAPGWTMTPLKRQLRRDPDQVRRVLQTIPLRKIANPADVANLCVFLASDRLAGHITGEIIPVSGGMEGRVLYHPQEVDPNIL